MHNVTRARPPFYLQMLCDADGHRCSYFRKAIEDCSTDSELGYLTVEGAGDNALAQEFEAVMGWTPPVGIDVPLWRCYILNTT